MSTVWELEPLTGTELVELDWLGHAIRVRREAGPAYRLAELRAVRSEYGVALATGRLNPSPTGAYVYRNRRPYPETPVTVAWHSEHAHGLAVDVNYDSNRLRTDGVLATDFDKFGLEDGCDWLAAFLVPPPGLNVLFRWGGGWTTDYRQACVNLRHNGEKIRTGTVDPMHFELVLTPAEVRSYDWKTAIQREARMNAKLEDAARFVEMLREELEPGRADATVGEAARRVARTVKRDEAERAAKPASDETEA